MWHTSVGSSRYWRDRALGYRSRSVLDRVKAGRPSEERMGGALAPPRTPIHTYTTHTRHTDTHTHRTDTHTCKPRARGPICQVDAIGLSQVREYVCTHTRVQTHDSKVSLGGASAPPIRVSGPASERQALCQLRRLGSVLLQHTAHPGRTLLAAVSP